MTDCYKRSFRGHYAHDLLWAYVYNYFEKEAFWSRMSGSNDSCPFPISSKCLVFCLQFLSLGDEHSGCSYL